MIGTVLIMGHRRPIARELERLGRPYCIWSEKPVKRAGKALIVVQAPFPKKEAQALELLKDVLPIEQVIAGTESAVFHASRVRKWIKARRNPPSAVVRCFDKLVMKAFLREKGIPMTPFLPGSRELVPEEVFAKLGKPVVVKERIGSGGRGLKVLKSEEELRKSINSKVLLEKEVRGKEGSVESLIDDGKILFENVTEYQVAGKSNLVPGHFKEPMLRAALQLNRSVIKALNIRWGLTHLEFYETASGLLFGEIALRPPGGYLMEAMRLAYGFNVWRAFVQIELGIAPELQAKAATKTRFAASVVLHPGEGVVQSIQGEKEVQNIPSLKKFKLKVKAGDLLLTRSSVGEDVGYALFAASSANELCEDLDAFAKTFKVTVQPSY